MKVPFNSGQSPAPLRSFYAWPDSASRQSALLRSFYQTLLVCCAVVGAQSVLSAQPASPANWLYPYGDAAATRAQPIPSFGTQDFDNLGVKWDRTDVYGAITPLVGNIVNNDKLDATFIWAPNELIAVVAQGGTKKLMLIGGDGKQISISDVPATVRRPSVLIDSNAILPDVFTVFPVIIGLEVVENQPADPDQGVSAYIAAYDAVNDTVSVIKRLTLDLREFDPNLAASITPVFGRSSGNEMIIYAAVNNSLPVVQTPNPIDPPFFRGLAQFKARDFDFPFPQPDILDDPLFRYTVGPIVSWAPPSITPSGGDVSLILPVRPDPNVGLSSPLFPSFGINPSLADELYVFDVLLTGTGMAQGSGWTSINSILSTSSAGAQVRSMSIELEDAGAGGAPAQFILVAEEYDARRGAAGIPSLHLLDAATGLQLTLPPSQTINPDSSFTGLRDHMWSIAVGDIDGLPDGVPNNFYPNNPGNEIVVTQSTPELAVAGNRLSVLRYRTGPRIAKPNLLNEELYFFDTLTTQAMNGWVACVNDFDGDPLDAKDEIFMVDNTAGVLRVLRMRSPASAEFFQGMPFDTVYERSFNGEVIESVVVSDMDGDGLNDILVTTQQRLYCIGTPISARLVITNPRRGDPPPAQLCPGDILPLQWDNLLGGTPFVNIYFQPYSGANPSGPRILLNDLPVPNTGDSEEFRVDFAALNISGEGRFIVQSTVEATVIDSSEIVSLGLLDISLDLPIDLDVYRAGDLVPLAGTTDCADEVLLQISTTGSVNTVWSDLGVTPVLPDGTFATTATMPCLPFFRCLAADLDSIVRFRAVAVNFGPPGTTDTSQVRTVKVIPDSLEITADPPPNIVCPERRFTILPPQFMPCDDLIFAISTDEGETFRRFDTIDVTAGEYLWIIPPELPDTVIVRFCCVDNCARTDMQVRGTTLRYVDVVAPNPFDPENPVAEASKPGVNVVYTVPRAMDVTIRIVDQAERIVAEPVTNEAREPGRTYCDAWNGILKRENAVAPNGMYYMILEFSDGSREVYPVFVAKAYQ